MVQTHMTLHVQRLPHQIFNITLNLMNNLMRVTNQSKLMSKLNQDTVLIVYFIFKLANNGNKCGGCEQGFCDAKSGRCICNDGWTGPHCDRRISAINKSHTSDRIHENHDSSATVSIFWKVL